MKKLSEKINARKDFSILLTKKVSNKNIEKIAEICDKNGLKFYQAKNRPVRSILEIIKDYVDDTPFMVLNFHLEDNDKTTLTHGSRNWEFGETKKMHRKYLHNRHLKGEPECFFVGECDFSIA